MNYSDFDIRRKRLPIEIMKINEGTHLHGNKKPVLL